VKFTGREAAAFAALTLIWGTTWAAIRVGLAGIPPLAGVGIRFTIAGALLLAIAWHQRAPLGRTRVERRLWIANAVATFMVPYGVIYWAEQIVPTGLSAILFSTFPLWVSIVGRRVLPGERPHAGQWLGVALGFAGIVVIFSEDFARLGAPGIRLRCLALLGAALVSASCSVAIKRWGGGVSPLSLSAVPMLAAGLATGAVAAAVERDAPWQLSAGPVLATLYLAVFGSAVTFTLYFWLLRRSSALSASLISYTAPVVAVAVGIAAFGEPMTARLGLGAVLVLAGVAAALRPH
jgi:drug/metabolite transporter (DMT)-like permease